MHLRTSQIPFIILNGYYHDVIKQQVNLHNYKLESCTSIRPLQINL